MSTGNVFKELSSMIPRRQGESMDLRTGCKLSLKRVGALSEGENPTLCISVDGFQVGYLCEQGVKLIHDCNKEWLMEHASSAQTPSEVGVGL
jgi:hypothetical protein